MLQSAFDSKPPSSPEKMALHDAQLVEKLLFEWCSIVNLMHGTVESYGPAHRCEQYNNKLHENIVETGMHGVG